MMTSRLPLRHQRLLLTLSVLQLCSRPVTATSKHLTRQQQKAAFAEPSAAALKSRPATAINRHEFVSNPQKEPLGPIRSRSARPSVRSVVLPMSSSDVDGGGAKKDKSKSRGVYSRPSAAIERGSGFFIPGLEGSRVRLLFGLMVLALTYVNRIVGADANIASDTQSLSEAVAVAYGLLLLFQAAVEFGKELGFGVDDPVGGAALDAAAAAAADSTSYSATASSLDQTMSPELAEMDRAAEAVRWAAATFVALTPATHVLLVGTSDEDGAAPTVYYTLGDFANHSREAAEGDGVQSAVDTVFASKGGRVSIPPDHPASEALLPEGSRRCVLLQRVGSRSDDGDDGRTCLMIGSDKLLPSFTKSDLRWLGRLGEYVKRSLS